MKHKKITSNFKRQSDLRRIGRDTISNSFSENRISIICFDAFNNKNCGDRNDRNNHADTMDRQNRRNCPIKFLDHGGNCDDRYDHMETRLQS